MNAPLFAIFLAATALLSAEALDKITLKDGRVLSGTVLEENEGKITFESKGVKRSYSRSLIKSIDYGEGPAEAQAAPAAKPASEGVSDKVPSAPTQGAAKPQASLTQELAVRYSVPEHEVLWVRRQGIGDRDLPLVFLVAATAHILPGVVVSLRLGGWSWDEIEYRYGMEPERVYFVAGPWVPWPYYRFGVYGGWGWGWGWHGYPRGWGHGYRHHRW